MQLSKLIKNRYPVLNKLKGLIREKNHTYTSLAKLVGMSHNGLSNKVNGHLAFDSAESLRIAEALGMDQQTFLDCFYPDYR